MKKLRVILTIGFYHIIKTPLNPIKVAELYKTNIIFYLHECRKNKVYEKEFLITGLYCQWRVRVFTLNLSLQYLETS